MSAAVLTKTERVLERDETTQLYVSFASPWDGDEAPTTPTYIELDRQTYFDMGQPEQITVTVVPGDTLNDDHRKDGYL